MGASHVIVMVVLQLAYGGQNILVKIALERGLNPFVFMVYRHLIAALILSPFAYVLERKRRRSLSFVLATKIFLISSLGTTIHLNIFYAGLKYTSPTVASALSNVNPGLTLLLSILLGCVSYISIWIEKVKLRTSKGKAKVVGTFVCMIGSFIFILWKGRVLSNGIRQRGRPLIPMIYGYNSNSTRDYSENHQLSTSLDNKMWIEGSLLIFISNIAWCAWLILQVNLYKMYPARLSLNVLVCLFATLQSTFLAIFWGRKRSVWKLGWNEQLATIFYAGVMISAFCFYMQTWCITKKGPVFAASFSPLILVVVATFSAFAFAEQLHLGSLIGAILIITGLYSVLWGKSTDTVVKDVAEGNLESLAKESVDDTTGDTNRVKTTDAV